MQILFIPFIILFLSLFALNRYLRANKGKFAEKWVHNKLLGLSDEYHIMDNVLFFGASGTRSTQIDHIVISPFGLFVIETKGYKGWIFGNENAEYWTQNIYGEKYQFYNPIRQNEGHIRFLRRIFRGFPDFPMIPIVVFNNEADISRLRVSNYDVVNRAYLNEAISHYKEAVINDDLRLRIIERLRACSTDPDKDAMAQHTMNAYRAIDHKEISVANGICPRCGGKLVLRQGKYGNFYGCSGYPRCRYTQHV